MSRATFGAGYGSSSRVYGTADAQLGMTPATYRRGGAGARIDYVIAKTSLGALLVAATERGVCAVTLGDDATTLEQALEREYPAATRTRVANASSSLGGWVADIAAAIDGERARADVSDRRTGLRPFSGSVCRELQKIPSARPAHTRDRQRDGSAKAVRAERVRAPTTASAVIRAVSSGRAVGRRAQRLSLGSRAQRKLRRTSVR